MKSVLKFCLLFCISICIGCNSDDDNSQLNNPISEYKINGSTTYATPNGYYSQYTTLGDRDNFTLYFIDGKFIPITNTQAGIPCPWVENMTQGITIRFRSNLDDEIGLGDYKYTTDNTIGIKSNSNAFYGFLSDDDCFSQTEENLKITDGEMTISKKDSLYTITYSFVSENGKKIDGVYYGKLKKYIELDW